MFPIGCIVGLYLSLTCNALGVLESSQLSPHPKQEENAKIYFATIHEPMKVTCIICIETSK